MEVSSSDATEHRLRARSCYNSAIRGVLCSHHGVVRKQGWAAVLRMEDLFLKAIDEVALEGPEGRVPCSCACYMLQLRRDSHMSQRTSWPGPNCTFALRAVQMYMFHSH